MKTRAVFFVLIILGLVFSFVPANYFYASEGNVSVTYKNFTLDGKSYSVVYFNSVETFLLKNGELVNDSSESSSVMRKFYLAQNYPSDAELQELRDMVAAYDVSRNNGYGTFKNQEEDSCNKALFNDQRIEVYINGKKQMLWCHDNESCDMQSKLLYQAYHEATGWGSPTQIYQPLVDFSTASFGTEYILNNMTYMLNNATPDNIVATVDYMKTNIPKLKTYASKIESTIFRYPRLNDSADVRACKGVCYGICPSLELDTTILDALLPKLDTLSVKIQPLVNYQDNSAAVGTRTHERVLYYQNTETTKRYDATFAPLEKKGQIVEKEAAAGYKLIANTSVMMKADEMQALRTSIRSRINAANFTGLDGDIDQYESMTNDLQKKTDGLFLLYNETTEAKMNANYYIFQLGTRDLSGGDLDGYNALKTRIEALNADFIDGMAPEKAAELKDNYTTATTDGAALLKTVSNSPIATATTPFRTFAMKMNQGLENIVAATKLADANAIPENRYAALGGFSLLVFVSFGAIVFLVFLGLIGIQKTRQIKYVLGAAFIIIMLFVGIFSGLLFFFMDKTAFDATMDEFLYDFSSKNKVAVVADLSLATDAESKGINECASSLSDVIKEKNKTVDVYALTASGCTKNGDEFSGDCKVALTAYDSVITLGPSTTIEKPELKTIFFSSADIKASTDYYNACPIATMFK
ncbi:MAG: hypothetical protein V1492_03890 [Candidatus Micrarchaeota archaeon]